ncbi:hypothetical protein JTB14_006388 [Gonioctena quinquepunctata]|nr:hypothetical protein JTB14_006388 [Gonioctena quinquepunctata]
MKTLIDAESWNDFLQNEDIEILANSLTQKILTCAKKFMAKMKHVKEKKIWITDGIITSINKRNKERHRDWENVELQSKYRTYRNNLNLLINETKAKLFKDKIENDINNPKKLWKTLRASKNQNNKETEIRYIRLRT